MPRNLTQAEARAFRERWRLVNEHEIEELRTTDLETRWRQLNTLFAWGRQMGWGEALTEGDAAVRQRWARIRKAHRG